jgi:DoxX-like family
MTAAAALAEALPQRVFCRETLALLARGDVPAHNAASALLGRAPATLEEGLRVTPPQPWLDLRVHFAPSVALLLRTSLAFMWLWTAAVSALLPGASGVRELLERCGFSPEALPWVLAASCLLNTGIGVALLLSWRRPGVHALQCAAIVGYTVTAAWHVPELTLDHCAPLVKNLPLLAAALLLWLAVPADRPAPRAVRRWVATPSA